MIFRAVQQTGFWLQNGNLIVKFDKAAVIFVRYLPSVDS